MGNLKVLKGLQFKGQSVDHSSLVDIRLEQCTFDNLHARGMAFRNIQLIGCSIWACGLRDPVIEDCLVDGLRMSLGSGGGKTHPFFIFGGVTKHLILRGRIEGLIWNPPDSFRAVKTGSKTQGIRYAPPSPWFYPFEYLRWKRILNYYSKVDWALDISKAEFTTVPGFRFGPPGRLIRRDSATQPLVTRAKALSTAYDRIKNQVGIWKFVIDDFLSNDWLDEIVLIPAKASKGYKQDLKGILILRDEGIVE